MSAPTTAASDGPPVITKFGLDVDELAQRELPYSATLFKDKTVLISGGSGGLGRAMAWMFARVGATVAISGRDTDRLEAAARPMREHGLDVHTFVCNIRRPEEVTGLFDAVAQRLGAIDVLVNNAGGQFPQAAIDFSPKGWNAVIDTNLNGTWYMMQEAAKRWRDGNRPGSIVNIVTVTDRGQPGVAHTCAARAGVIALSKTVAVEWAPYRIRINCIAPGAINTEGQRVYSEAARRRSARSNPMLRFGDAFDVADAAIYLSGPTGKFITGESLVVDGGGLLWGDFWVAEQRPTYFDEPPPIAAAT